MPERVEQRSAVVAQCGRLAEDELAFRHVLGLLQLALADDGLNYLELYVGKGPAGTPRFYDAYDYVNGARISGFNESKLRRLVFGS